jgi:hypothetical protein
VLAFRGPLLGVHSILNGRSAAERIDRVVAFTGQSIAGSGSEAVLLRLSDSAEEFVQPSPQGRPGRSVAGRAQGLALEHGRGRVVMLGEASMISAQLSPPRPGADTIPRKMGMNYPGFHNKQFTLNVVRWLSRVLP